ncbi:dihydrofolate reductase family protein [Demequina mangrovi]|uniref:Dihydrofolate reductase n=1 Tax=Demequina mangrovi TaxID=1043493 RepID=A0A1H7AC18_9MICO|nr:dihydrofolate reductase family protein [Demequina mangrovi]SEJ63169.1 Dihydrofolate reductase [Demequina mangrovi]
MGRLIYAFNCSLDGYINDVDGAFDWSVPDEELHDYFTDLCWTASTLLYGRRIYETMRVWEDLRGDPEQPRAMRDYAEAWCAAEKIVYSATLDDPGYPRTRVERGFDAAEVAALKQRSASDLSIAGAELASHALRAGLVDEIQLAIAPVIVGGGTRMLPDGIGLDLELVEHRRFPEGALLVRYEVKGARGG